MDIRALAMENGVKLWEIAEALGVTDGNFSRKLRRELDADEKKRIVEIVNRISSAKNGGKRGNG